MNPNIHQTVKIHPTARIDCPDLTIGVGGVIGEGCVLEGHRIEIGRELWMDAGARIGGGSCHDPMAFLKAGDFLHLGKGSELNTARGIMLGDEVGIGIGTSVFTHGAYLDELAGFPCVFAPVVIGSRAWLPHARVNPGVTIGDDVVVGAGAVVHRDLPSGCLAGGVPCKVLKEGAYPRVLSNEEKGAILDRIVKECAQIMHGAQIRRDGMCLFAERAKFDIAARRIDGFITPLADTLKNQLRRHGIRFPVSVVDGEYRPWE